MGKQYGILKRILNNLESSTLPTATPQDKDKVATVDENGAWQAKQPSGGSVSGVPVAHVVYEETVAISGTLPDVAGYQWIPRQSDPSGEVTKGPFIQIDLDNDSDFISPEVFIKPMTGTSWGQVNPNYVTEGRGYVKIDVGYFGVDGQYPSEDDFNGALIKVVSETITRLDKTYKELVDSGFFVVHTVGMDGQLPNQVGLLIPGVFAGVDPVCFVVLVELTSGRVVVFVASTENDYPVLSNGGSSEPTSL